MITQVKKYSELAQNRPRHSSLQYQSTKYGRKTIRELNLEEVTANSVAINKKWHINKTQLDAGLLTGWQQYEPYDSGQNSKNKSDIAHFRIRSQSYTHDLHQKLKRSRVENISMNANLTPVYLPNKCTSQRFTCVIQQSIRNRQMTDFESSKLKDVALVLTQQNQLKKDKRKENYQMSNALIVIPNCLKKHQVQKLLKMRHAGNRYSKSKMFRNRKLQWQQTSKINNISNNIMNLDSSNLPKSKVINSKRKQSKQIYASSWVCSQIQRLSTLIKQEKSVIHISSAINSNRY